MTELSTKFNFRDIEETWCRHWEDQNVFHAAANPDKKPFSVVIPPPNVTGILHMGHALNNTLQDITVRYARMRGFEVCWMPGTDHAGIATQNVVERKLTKENKTRYDIGREEMLKRLWDWKAQYGDTIINQLKRLGASCDWPRTRFTMDDGYSRAVREVFVRLYEKGLIYQGRYIINWCPRCQTALSDEESEHREQQGALYYIRYPLKDKSQKFLVVATTRPETMLGDTAVAVHPKDPRFQQWIGARLILPIVNREIPVIGDEFVDPEFGTGAVKVTPAHDPNDFDIGRRHDLPFVNIMNPDGILNNEAGEFAGTDRFEAREAIVEALKGLKLLEKVEQHTHAVGHCYRCHTVVEPYLSKQWFVKMKPLAAPALKAVEEGTIRFVPERWTKVYLNWMENIRDWCISRQIWWGHRLPVWYCPDCPEGKNIIVSLETPKGCPTCGNTDLRQDEDVLDTWFSSWLWPFATFGWPQQNDDLKYFYPTGGLFTASEIIFFWVARMIMAGLEFMNDIPFSDVYIHGTVRDTKGRKMSKSLGNAIDPLEIINDYGADALRFSLIINSGQDLYISKEKFTIGRNFANKIWNAARLVLMNRPEGDDATKPMTDKDFQRLDLPSRWIISRLYSTVNNVSLAVEEYRFSEAENLIHEFFWRTYCDWYLEIIKNRFDDPLIQSSSFRVLLESLKIIHPFMPFVTEEIWKHLNITESCLSVQPWPAPQDQFINPKDEREMGLIMELVSAVRNLRAQWNIKPQQKIDCYLTAPTKGIRDLFQANAATIQSLSSIKDFSIQEKLDDIKDAAAGILTGGVKFILPLGGIIDIAQEKKRIRGQIEGHQKNSTALTQRLGNKAFVEKAPPDVVKKEQQRLEHLKAKVEELEKVLSTLG